MTDLGIFISRTVLAEAKTNTASTPTPVCQAARLSALPDAHAHICNLHSRDRWNKHEASSIGRGKMKGFSCGNERPLLPFSFLCKKIDWAGAREQNKLTALVCKA